MWKVYINSAAHRIWMLTNWWYFLFPNSDKWNHNLGHDDLCLHFHLWFIQVLFSDTHLQCSIVEVHNDGFLCSEPFLHEQTVGLVDSIYMMQNVSSMDEVLIHILGKVQQSASLNPKVSLWTSRWFTWHWSESKVYTLLLRSLYCIVLKIQNMDIWL